MIAQSGKKFNQRDSTADNSLSTENSLPSPTLTTISHTIQTDSTPTPSPTKMPLASSKTLLETATSIPPTSPEKSPVTQTPTAPTTKESTTRAFKCEHVGRFPHPSSCAKYYYCWDSRHRYAVFRCPKVFDPVLKRCVNNYAQCALTPECTADRQVMPYPDDKQAFLECRLKETNGIKPVYTVRKRKCADGREFDPGLNSCVLILSIDSNSSESGSIEEFECKRVGKFIDTTSDTHYIECRVKSVVKGTFENIRHKCPKLAVFSAVDQKCVSL